MRAWVLSCFFVLSAFADAPFQADLEGAAVFNSRLSGLKQQLKETFDRAHAFSEKETNLEEYRSLLAEVQKIKGDIRSLEENWRKASVEETSGVDDAYALWDVGETTLSQLVMEYGAGDFLYIIPQELSAMKISLFSNIALPRESWNEMIEMILTQNGVGVKKINPFVKQLYILKLDPSAVEGIVSRVDELQLFANHARIFYVFSPPSEQVKSVQGFFERFSDPKQTTVQAVGSKVAIVSTKETVEKLLGLYSAVWEKTQGKVVKLVPLSKIQGAEAEKVLKAVFAESAGRARPNFYPTAAEELVTLLLPQGLVLVGEGDSVERGQRILHELESQLEDPAEKVIYWYTCKHSDPEDVAAVLEKVYDSLIGVSLEKKTEIPAPAVVPPPVPPLPDQPSIGQVFPDKSTAFNPVLPVNPPFVQPGIIEKKPKSNFGNFVVDAKTTSILMVVRREELGKIKSLLKKLDVPKKMVQIDVMLVEKRLRDQRQIGFNLLQVGANASGINQNSINFNTDSSFNLPIGKSGADEKTDRFFPFHRGVLSYLFSRERSDAFPAVDLMFNFLLTQEDIRINANPSVLAINQTEALISILEEISINNGAIQLNTSGGVTIEQAYTRAQYGTTIKLTPTIQASDLDDSGEPGPGFVALKTNITFDTTLMTANDRPPVIRRHIENEVRIADGETVILGGLRRKNEEDVREKIPFLGDLPGIGKLFGLTKQNEVNTEMFIFLTPHIIQDPVEDLRRIRQCEYMKRAGDIPEFLQKLDEAKAKERKKLFSHSLKTLFEMY